MGYDRWKVATTVNFNPDQLLRQLEIGLAPVFELTERAKQLGVELTYRREVWTVSIEVRRVGGRKSDTILAEGPSPEAAVAKLVEMRDFWSSKRL